MDKDPWDWTIDEVVQNLVGEKGLLRRFNFDDHTILNITSLIRDSGTDGCELLLLTYEPTNPEKGLHQLQWSQWRKLEIVIEKLRYRSEEYIQHLKEKEQQAARFQPFLAIRDSLGHQRAVPHSPTTSRASSTIFKTEQLNSRYGSVRPSESRESGLLDSGAHQPTVPSNTSQHLALLEATDASTIDDGHTILHHEIPNLKRLRSNGSSDGHVENEPSAGSLSDILKSEGAFRAETYAEVRLRENETMIVDEHGRKRRKLQVLARDSSGPTLSTSIPMEGSTHSRGGQSNQDAATGASNFVEHGILPLPGDLKDAEIGPATTATTPGEMRDVNKIITANEPRETAAGPQIELMEPVLKAHCAVDVVSSPPYSPRDELVTFHTVSEKQTTDADPFNDNLSDSIREEGMNHRRPVDEPEILNGSGDKCMVIEPQKMKKRLQPQLIGPIITHAQQEEEQIQPPINIEAEMVSNSHNSEEPLVVSNVRARNRMVSRPRCEYLGCPLPVDRVFYGNTKLGELVRYDASEASPPFATFDLDPDNFCFLSSGALPTGQSLVVAQLMRGFLYRDNVRHLVYDQKHLTAIIPYNVRISKRSQQPSLTLLTRSGNSMIARRVNRARWLKYDAANKVSVSSKGENSQTLEFDVEQEESPLLSVGRDEVHEYDFLEKWQHQADDSILPAYGESGSEGEYDLETWNEMKLEQGTLERIPAPPSKNRLIDVERANTIVKEAEIAFKERWRLRKLPKLTPKAWSLWKRSRRRHTYRDQLESYRSEVERLDRQFLKIKKEILKESWTSEGRLKAQCKSFDVSVSDRETCRWKISVLESSSAPSKPPPSQKLPQKAPSRHSQESLRDGEEDIESSSVESLDEDLEDFISEDQIDEHDDAEDILDMGDKIISGNSSNDKRVPDTSEPESGSQLEEVTENTVPQAAEKRESIMSRRSIVFRKKTVLPEEETSKFDQLGPASSSPLPKLENSSASITKSLTKRSSFSEYPSLLATTAHIASSTEPEVIDLTNFTDSEEQVPQLCQQGKRIATPPVFVKAEADDPFSRPNNPKCGFRMPPVSSSNNNHDSSMESATIIKKSSKGRSENVPALDEVDEIAKMDPKYLKQIDDRDRLLIWMIHRAGSSQRRRVIKLIKLQKNLGILQVHLWDGMRAMEDGADAPGDLAWDEMSVDQAQAYMRLAAWFVCWSQCSIAFPEGSSQDSPAFPKRDVNKAINDEANFETFYNTVKRRLQCFAERKKLQSTLLGSSPSNSKKKRIRRVVSGSEDSEDKRSSKRKKRVYEVAESQQALELQRTGKLRIEQQERRKKEMNERMKRLGATSNDTSVKIINTSATPDQGIIVISPRITSKIQAHQLDGVRFLWREVVAANQGCLLAHTMGLGKTMQVITLLVTIAEAAKSKDKSIRAQIPKNLRSSHTLILSPPSLVENWNDEFLMWAPDPRSENVGNVWKIGSDLRIEDRLMEIELWDKNGGVLILGYDAFRNLIQNPKRGKSKSALIEEERHQTILQVLLERPKIVVADEAHTVKNPASAISKAVAQFSTKNRIALTGSPLSNNLEEYYSLISWTAPGYLGERHEFRAKYVEPIAAGLYEESTDREKRNCLKMLRQLSIQLEPKMQRQDITVLKKQLSKSEFVIYVPLTRIQRQAYELFAKSVLSATGGKDPQPARIWATLSVLRLLCNHPKCFRDKLMAIKEEPKNPKTRETIPALEKLIGDAVEDDEESIPEDAIDTAEALLPKVGMTEETLSQQLKMFESINGSIGLVDLSNKMVVLMRIIAFSEEAQDKVLVFSHSKPTLNIIEKTLIERGYEYARLDGDTPMQTRNQLTKRFNAGKASNICIISTRAGGQGLNLFGANRVVIVDDDFNPMHEEQAIGRAYRIGQEKHVFVYRLTIGGTFEETLQNQSLFKVQLATRVVDKKHNSRFALGSLKEYLRIPQEPSQKDLSSLQGKDALVLDRILADAQTSSVIRSILPSETFKDLEPLTAEEEKEVEENLRLENLRKIDPQAYRIELNKHEHAMQQKAFRDIRAQEQAGFPSEVQISTTFPNILASSSSYPPALTNAYAPRPFPRNSADHIATQVGNMHIAQPDNPRNGPASSGSTSTLQPGLVPSNSREGNDSQLRVKQVPETDLEAIRSGTRKPPKWWRPSANSADFPFTQAFIEYLQSPGADVTTQQAKYFLAFADSEAYKKQRNANLPQLLRPLTNNPQCAASNPQEHRTLSGSPFSTPRQEMSISKALGAGPPSTQLAKRGISGFSPLASVSRGESISSSRRSSESVPTNGNKTIIDIADVQRAKYRDKLCRRIVSRLPFRVGKDVFTAMNDQELCERLAIRFERTAKQKALGGKRSYRQEVSEILKWIEDDLRLGSFMRAEKKQPKAPTVSPARTRHTTPETSEAKRPTSSLSESSKQPLQSPKLARATLPDVGSTDITPSSPQLTRVENDHLSELQQTIPSFLDTTMEVGKTIGATDGASDEDVHHDESNTRNVRPISTDLSTPSLYPSLQALLVREWKSGKLPYKR